MTTIFFTGGHYTCAKAVMEELEQSGGWKIYYIGSKKSFEGDTAESFEFQDLKNNSQVTFLPIIAGRLQRQFSGQTMLALLKTPVGFCQSLVWLVQFRPAVVVSFGGYIALPVALTAAALGIPVITHEQTTVFGLANRIIARVSQKILVSFKNTMPSQPNPKWAWVGNPVRKDVLSPKFSGAVLTLKELKKKTDLPVVYLTGGKQGSHLLNSVILANLEALLEKVILILQVGDNREFADFVHFEKEIVQLSPDLRQRVLLRKFIFSDEIGAVFNLADLVISRSGANVIFDLSATSRPAILVPITWSAGGEQLKNAQEFVSFGAGEIVTENAVKDDLLPQIWRVLDHLDTYRHGAIGASELVVSDSAKRIKKIVEQVVQR